MTDNQNFIQILLRTKLLVCFWICRKKSYKRYCTLVRKSYCYTTCVPLVSASASASVSTCKMLGQMLRSIFNISVFFLHFNFACHTNRAPYNKGLHSGTFGFSFWSHLVCKGDTFTHVNGDGSFSGSKRLQKC